MPPESREQPTHMNDVYRLRVKGKRALFTNPANTNHRRSYLAPTPEAAKGVLRAIYGHPWFEWNIVKIDVLSPLAMFAPMGVNERKDAKDMKGRYQRSNQYVRNPEYVIHAYPSLLPDVPRDRYPERVVSLKKAGDVFCRRAEKGQCFWHPFLGTRECGLDEWALVGDHEDIETNGVDVDLGTMFHSWRKNVRFVDDGRFRVEETGTRKPQFFRSAKLKNGTLHCEGADVFVNDRVEE